MFMLLIHVLSQIQEIVNLVKWYIKQFLKNPQTTVCVVGCYSQVAPQDIEAIEGVSIILGTQFRNEIVDLVEKYQQTHERIVKVSEVKQLRKFEDLNIDRFYIQELI